MDLISCFPIIVFASFEGVCFYTNFANYKVATLFAGQHLGHECTPKFRKTELAQNKSAETKFAKTTLAEQHLLKQNHSNTMPKHKIR